MQIHFIKQNKHLRTGIMYGGPLNLTAMGSKLDLRTLCAPDTIAVINVKVMMRAVAFVTDAFDFLLRDPLMHSCRFYDTSSNSES